MEFELRHLRTFVAVAEELHFGRAATRLGTAQPPVSSTIASIERKLGTQLLNRTSRRVSLTPAGESLLAEARRLIAVADQTFLRIDELRGGSAGKLRIGTAPSVLAAVGPPIINRFRDLAPGAEIHVDDTFHERQTSMLQEGAIDISFVVWPDTSGEPAEEELVFVPLQRERLVAAVGPEHRLASRKRIRLEEFEGEQLILWSREWLPPLYDEILRACRERGFSPKILHHGLLLMARQALISAGMGYAVEPMSFWSPLRDITLLDISPAAPSVTYYLAHREADTSPLVRAFIESAKPTPNPVVYLPRRAG